MTKKLILSVLSLVLCVMVVSPAIASVVEAKELKMPLPTGTYKVGAVWRHWTDDSRDELFDQAPHGKREMMVEILYPASPIAGAKTAAYMVNKKVVLPAFGDLANANGIAYSPTPEDVAGIETHNYLDAPLSTNHPQYPVLIFSHGAGGEVTMYTAQLEDLASHGYIVVAINHGYGAAATVFPDGRTVKFDLSKGLDGTAPIWSQDQIFVIDQLEKLNQHDPDELFSNHLNLSHLGVFGHSLGGSAATMTCFVDKRCKAGANEDGPVFGDVLEQGLQQPFMYMVTDHRFFYAPNSYKNSHGPYYEITLKGFEHLDFGDWPLWNNVSSLHDVFWLGSVDSARSKTITGRYLLAFFDQYLKGSDETLLDGLSPEYPEVSIQTQNVILSKIRSM